MDRVPVVVPRVISCDHHVFIRHRRRLLFVPADERIPFLRRFARRQARRRRAVFEGSAREVVVREVVARDLVRDRVGDSIIVQLDRHCIRRLLRHRVAKPRIGMLIGKPGIGFLLAGSVIRGAHAHLLGVSFGVARYNFVPAGERLLVMLDGEFDLFVPAVPEGDFRFAIQRHRGGLHIVERIVVVHPCEGEGFALLCRLVRDGILHGDGIPVLIPEQVAVRVRFQIENLVAVHAGERRVGKDQRVRIAGKLDGIPSLHLIAVEGDALQGIAVDRQAVTAHGNLIAKALVGYADGVGDGFPVRVHVAYRIADLDLLPAGVQRDLPLDDGADYKRSLAALINIPAGEHVARALGDIIRAVFRGVGHASGNVRVRIKRAAAFIVDAVVDLDLRRLPVRVER